MGGHVDMTSQTPKWATGDGEGTQIPQGRVGALPRLSETHRTAPLTSTLSVLQGERGKPGLPGEKGEAGDPVSAEPLALQGGGDLAVETSRRTAHF